MATRKDNTAADIEILRAGLGELPTPSKLPKLILFSGLPSTGKTYLAARLAQKLGAVVLGSDTCRQRLVRTSSYHWRESRCIFKAMHRLAEKLVQSGVSVILGATYLKEADRAAVYQIAANSEIPLTIFRVEAPENIVIQWLAARAMAAVEVSKADWCLYLRLRPSVVKVSYWHRVIDGTSYTAAIIAIMEATIHCEA